MASMSPPVNWELKREPDDFSLWQQPELPLMGRLDGPSVVPTHLIQHARSYRQACQMAFALRRVKGLTRRSLAEACGVYASHITEYLSSDESRREMPARYIAAFEQVVGNTAISQWIAAGAKLTVLEEMQAARRVA